MLETEWGKGALWWSISMQIIMSIVKFFLLSDNLAICLSLLNFNARNPQYDTLSS